MFFSLFIEKIRTIILGKEKPSGGFPTQEQFEKIAKLEASEKQKLEEKAKRRENLEDMLKTHYHQIIDEVYEKWFERSSSSVIGGVVTKYEYNISNASIIYTDKLEIKTIKLEEPSHQNKTLTAEAIEHLQHYPETYSLWDTTKTSVDQNLNDVEKLWNYLIQSLTCKLSTKCPQLVEWHGYGVKYMDYYSMRNTFNLLWECINDNRYLSELKIYPDGKYFCIKDCATSSSNNVMEQFILVITNLAKGSVIQERIKKINTNKEIIETNLKSFHKSLKEIIDDVKRKNKSLKNSCPTCKPWLTLDL